MESEAAYEVKVGTFEGPLELLLHLIKKNEINIYDIPIALITQQYIETLDLMKSLNLSIAGEFLVMAATLIHIKSKTLLPPAEEEADEEDPRRELVARLLEYQKFKDAAEQLEERESLWREIFRKEPSPSPELLPEEVPLVDLDLYDLLDALKNVLAKIPDKKVLQVTIDELTVKDRMQFLMERMGTIESILFDDLFEGIRTRHSVVVTFLALLEIIRLGLVRVVQGDVCGPLRLFKTKNLSGEVE
ncbi:MAG: segregation/condensation protein A [Candidatus Manganitrophus sp.]|nr:segregation/condensation protein A [Candidatus Manganitrophus morganii]MDC4203379.1 segregation/condensation protein A [Candidatus Manganitrophus sp.]MDC4225056.1 segregation/condensation protein A [Candidatus Manganitrophus sp.]WDT71686.1 MAG: segregation/condensation protein A [Candidatus Manganitrophus sp.]WDT76067.1 MAG: segregation/condensation protein A [Candidatus Manganitrophus sp.]